MTSLANLFSPAKTSGSLTDKYTAGGSDTFSGLSSQGKLYAQSLRDQLERFDPSAFSVEPTLQLNQLGLTAGQQGGFDEAVRQAMSRLSGNFAGRGFNTPNAIPALAGSAAQYVLPQFAPLMSQNLGQLYEQQFRPEAIRAAREQLKLEQGAALLPQYQISTGMQRGPGLGYQANRDAVSNWYNMWNKIGSTWGTLGSGGGKV